MKHDETMGMFKEKPWRTPEITRLSLSFQEFIDCTSPKVWGRADLMRSSLLCVHIEKEYIHLYVHTIHAYIYN